MRKKRLAKFTIAEDKAWTFAFNYYRDNGNTSLQADRKAWRDVQDEFPRLRKYEGARP